MNAYRLLQTVHTERRTHDQPLHALSVDGVPATLQKQQHAPGALERTRGVLTVDEPAQQQV